MRILVVDDNQMHRATAISTLVGHDVTVISSFDEAMNLMKERFDEIKIQLLLENAGFAISPTHKDNAKYNAYCKAYENAQANSIIPFPFEVVLTDLMMPKKIGTIECWETYKGEKKSYGYVIALRAALCGAKFVAIVTDSNTSLYQLGDTHSNLGKVYSHNNSKPNFVINGSKAMFVHAPFCGVLGTICTICSGSKRVTHECYSCGGTGCWKHHGTGSCSRCEGSGKLIESCETCKGDGLRHDGKDWGAVLARLIA